MRACGVDILLSAPQKGWSSTPCAGLVLLGETAAERLQETRSSSFACDLQRWRQIMQAYEKGGHAYHATLPTDSLLQFRDAMQETVALGLGEVAREGLQRASLRQPGRGQLVQRCRLSPRAKMEATKFSTSTEQTSQ